MKINDKFSNCLEMCKYIERKSFEKDLRERLCRDLVGFSFFVCGNEMTKKQYEYVNKVIGLDKRITKKDYVAVTQDFMLSHMDVIKVFVQNDVCFGSSDIRFNGKKAIYLRDMFYTFGMDLCELGSEKNHEESVRRVNVCIQAMAGHILESTVKSMQDKKKAEDIKADNPVPDLKGPFAQESKEQERTEIQEEVVKKDDRTLEELIVELNQLTGLKSVKDEINGLINIAKISKIRKDRGFKDISISKHMVFSGNPGTGKTTVARLLSNIYYKLGVLSKGQLVEVGRSELVAAYTGQTAIKTDQVIKQALGGILFIDEVYTLTENKGEGDFGQEAVDTLLKAMEDNRDDLVVVVAGYPDLMEGFLNSNPGLKSRFNKFICFEDYNEDELFDIFKGMCSARDYKLNEEDEESVKAKIKSLLESKDKSFANARTMRNMLEFAIMQQATRIVSLEELEDEELLTIRYKDIEKYTTTKAGPS